MSIFATIGPQKATILEKIFKVVFLYELLFKFLIFSQNVNGATLDKGQSISIQ